MSDARMLPLKNVAKPGRYGVGLPGVTLSVVHPVILSMVIARKSKSKTVLKALEAMIGATIMAAGPDQYFVEGVHHAEIKKRLADSCSVIDQSHGRVVIQIAGPKARAVLAKGTPVDLHADQFPIGKSAMTQMAHVGVHITRTGNDEPAVWCSCFEC
jgi:methylglutamate dehydrogenase subunit D